MKIITYLKFKGQCEEALNTYKELFGAKVTCMIKYDEAMTDNKALIGKVFHAQLKINEFFIFMADTTEDFNYEKQAYKISVECDSIEAANKYFDTLSVGGTILQPITKMPWGDYMGHLRDTYGITWDFIFGC